MSHPWSVFTHGSASLISLEMTINQDFLISVFTGEHNWVHAYWLQKIIPIQILVSEISNLLPCGIAESSSVFWQHMSEIMVAMVVNDVIIQLLGDQLEVKNGWNVSWPHIQMEVSNAITNNHAFQRNDWLFLHCCLNIVLIDLP